MNDNDVYLNYNNHKSIDLVIYQNQRLKILIHR